MSIHSFLDCLKPRVRPAPARRSRRPACRPRLETLEDRFAPAGYAQTNLAADTPGVALVHDPELIDAWGISINPTGTFWLSARATDVSTVYSGDVTRPDGTVSPFVKSALTVTIPGGKPTGQVFNGSSDFVVTSGTQSAPARFIFASETGHITGWNAGVPAPPAPSRIAHIMASTPGAVYTGLAIGNNGVGNFLYAADFAGGKIDVFDKTYAPTTLGSFVDPNIPDDYAPFNIWNLGGELFVTYARPKLAGDGLTRGGTGFISAFDTDGNFLRRVISQNHLLSPWGVAIAPSDFGELSNTLLVANHQTGHVNAFDPQTGAFLSRMRDPSGDVLKIDGLYALHFGNGTVSGDRNALYFAAAPEDGAHGLFGSLRVGAVDAAFETSSSLDAGVPGALNASGASGWIADPVGDFLPGYTGPQDPGLDVIAHRATVTPQRVIFAGKMAGPIAPTQEIGGLYIIGVDRGQGTARFAGRTPVIGPNVLWDSVVRINPDGTGLFNNIIAGVVTQLNPADITIDGNEFSVSVPLSAMLPSATRPPEEWTYNLWPRNSAVIGNNAAVPDLAPDDGNSPMRVVPSARRARATSSPTTTSSLAAMVLESGRFDALVPAFSGLDNAVGRFVPPNPIRVAPVFALNDGDSADLVIPDGLGVASELYPVDSSLTLSPIFLGLADEEGGPVDAAT
jgi:uncharacterized protein (TIGR03118 family)